MSTKEPFVPGNTSIRKAELREGYFCTTHNDYVKPIIVRVGDSNYPACEICFLNDLQEAGGKLGDPIDTGIETGEEQFDDELVGETEMDDEDPRTEELCSGE